jgi:hypothetical protein
MSRGAEMIGNIASAKSDGTELSTGWTVPTGYRVYLVPGGLEISARLGTAEELRNLVKLLRAGIVILENTAEFQLPEPIWDSWSSAVRLDARVPSTPPPIEAIPV